MSVLAVLDSCAQSVIPFSEIALSNNRIEGQAGVSWRGQPARVPLGPGMYIDARMREARREDGLCQLCAHSPCFGAE
jgi:hypothetical protein